MQKIGVALSGGGIRSFSQLPIMRAIEEDGIIISALSGTSMGSVIAGLLACGLSADEVSEIVLRLEGTLTERRTFRRFSKKLNPFNKEKVLGGYVDGVELEELLIEVLEPLGIKMISDVKIPLAIPAVDLITGKTIVFVSHPELFKSLEDEWIVETDVTLSLAIRASCSFPFVIGSVEFGDYKLVDGGLTMNLPVPLLDGYKVDKTIGVTMHTDSDFSGDFSVIPLATRVMDIMRIQTDKSILEHTDVILNVPLDTIQIFDIGKGRATIEAGQRIINEKRSALSKIIYKEPWYKTIFKKK